MGQPGAKLGWLFTQNTKHDMMLTRTFRLMGLCLHSDMDLQVVRSSGCTKSHCIHLVKVESFPPRSTSAIAYGPQSITPGKVSAFEDLNGFQAEIPAVGRFWFREEQDEIRYELAPDHVLQDVEHWLLGFVLGLWRAKKGEPALHAAAVAIGGHGVAFIGPGGIGKTTLTASFGRAGFQLLAEDTLPIRWLDGTLVAEGYVPGLKLWPESLEGLGCSEESYPRAISWLDKRRVLLDASWGRCANKPLPLSVIFDLRPSWSQISAQISSPGRREAAMRVFASLYLVDALSSDQQLNALDAATRIAESVPVRRISYFRSFENLPAIREAILRDVEEITGG